MADNGRGGLVALGLAGVFFLGMAALVLSWILAPIPPPEPVTEETAEGVGELGGARTVQVHGYTRSDGTHVRGYSRAARGCAGGRR